MSEISLNEYCELVKNSRAKRFPTPYELVYNNFVSLEYDKQPCSFFYKNASSIVEKLRDKCWNSFVPVERAFTSDMLRLLVDDTDISSLSPSEAITWFVERFPEHIYTLTLSNTQSRRSRAGKEFEAIIELIIIGSGLSMDSQGNIGKQAFIKKGLGKLVDVVSPGVIEYAIDKNDTVLISAKTTLRERWQEVPEELGRTGAREMFLATLDPSISNEVLDTLYEANIRITTTKSIKEACYSENRRVLTFEQLLEICASNYNRWHDYNYTAQQREQIRNTIEIQMDKHSAHSYLLEYYKRRLSII